jgi:hypothetical protein
MMRVKPLKFGFFGFGKYPKCKTHHVPLVYVDERIEEFVDGALACLFDKAGLPSSELISMVASKYSEEMNIFIHGWVYCITIGRGAPIISRYLDSISKAYLKKLNRKQAKVLKKGELGKHAGKYQTLEDGLKTITTQYARVLKHLRVHSEVLVDAKSLKSLSSGLRQDLKKWQEGIIKEFLSKNPFEKGCMKDLIKTKRYYDHVLNVSTCRCLIGMDSEIKKLKVTAFDRFSAYEDFHSEGITEKFSKSDLKKLEMSMRLNNPFHNNGIKLENNRYVSLLNSNKKKDKMNLFETDEKIKNYLKEEIDWNPDLEFWTIENKINQYRTEKIILNPWADVSELNPLYCHRDWMKKVVEDKALNLTDSKLAKICGITERRLINWRNTIHGIKKGICATNSEGNIIQTTSDQRSVGKPKHDCNQLNSENTNSEYSRKFLTDLMALLEKHPEALAKRWPNRVGKYSHIQLSKLFGREKHYINRVGVKAKKDPDYRINNERVEDLKINLVKKLGAKALGCISIINSYDKQEINTIEFIKKMEHELGRVSGDVPLSPKKFSEMISNSPTSIVATMSNRFNPKSVTYQPNYLFSKDRLEEFKENIENNLSICDKEIDRLFSNYIENNPDIITKKPINFFITYTKVIFYVFLEFF